MMGISASPFSFSPTFKTSRCCSSIIPPSQSPDPFPFSILKHRRRSLGGFNRSNGVRCNSSGTPGPGSGENDRKAVLDAFFLGKAFAEALNERIGSTVGEILSVVGQWQAEQQKQVQDFQDEVVERAKRAKVKAALEIMEDQGIIPKSLTPPPDVVTPVTPPSTGPTTEDTGPTTEDPLQETLKD